MIKLNELLTDGMKKAPAFILVGALIGATIAAGLASLAVPGIAESFGIGPILGFGLVGAMGGATTGAILATGLGATESFDTQMSNKEIGVSLPATPDGPEKLISTFAEPNPEAIKSFEEKFMARGRTFNIKRY